jgi:hypothetical protein
MSQLSQPPAILKHLWNVVFAIFYPALVVFSLAFTGILLVFSNLSRLVFGIIKLFSKKDPQSTPIRRSKSAHAHH